MVLDDNAAATRKTFLVLLNPGFLIDPKLDFKKLSDTQAFFSLLDQVVIPSWFFGQSSKQMFNLYGNILNNKILPTVTLDDDEKKRLAKASSCLYVSAPLKKTDNYNSYQKARSRFLLAWDAHQSALNANPGNDPPGAIEAELANAREDFDAIRVNIEGCIDDYRALTYKSTNGKWGELRTQYDAATSTFSGKKFGLYNFYPTYPSLFDKDLTWTTLGLNSKDSSETTVNGATNYGGGIDAGFAMWRVGVNVSGSTNWKNVDNWADTFDFSGEFTQVKLFRLYSQDDDVFDSDAWTWPKKETPGVNTSLLTNGVSDLDNAVFPAGQMPFLPVGLLLAKNVKVTANWEHNIENWYKSEFKGGGGIAWGPFNFGGHYNHSEEKDVKTADVKGATVGMGSPQIIGVYVTVLDKMPRPNPAYNWPADAKLDFGVSKFVPPPAPVLSEAQRNSDGIAQADAAIAKFKKK